MSFLFITPLLHHPSIYAHTDHDSLSRKRECVSQLAYRMCEDNAVETLMSFNFAGLANEVQEALAFKARNVDPRSLPAWSRILYTWYIRRGDYRNGEFVIAYCIIFLTPSVAALAMYQRARKVQDLIYDPSTFDSLAEEQLDAYSIAINALSLVDPKNAWILLPITLESAHEVGHHLLSMLRY